MTGTVTWLAVSRWKSHSVISYLPQFFSVRTRGAEFHTFECGILTGSQYIVVAHRFIFTTACMHVCVCVFIVDPVIHHEDRIVVHGDKLVILHCNASDPEPVLWQMKHYWEESVREVYDGEEVFDRYKGRFTIDDVTHDLVIPRPVVSDTAEFWCIEKQGFGKRHITQLYVTGTAVF